MEGDFGESVAVQSRSRPEEGNGVGYLHWARRHNEDSAGGRDGPWGEEGVVLRLRIAAAAAAADVAGVVVVVVDYWRETCVFEGLPEKVVGEDLAADVQQHLSGLAVALP